MKIAGYIKTSVIEWPEKIVSVIFVPGCNFRCPFCHNADLVKKHNLTFIKEEEVFADLKRRKKWIDGVVISGGEPTLQKDLDSFLNRLRQMGLKTMVETNGSQPKIIAGLIDSKLLDYIAIDVKGPFEEYPKYTNLKSQRSNIESSIKLILNSGVDFEFRTTVVPGLHNERILIQMAKELKSLINDCKSRIKNFSWFLQNFQPKNCLDPEFEKRKPFSQKEVQKFLKVVREIIPQVKIRI